MRYVLDACALLAFLNKEDGWEKVRGLLTEAVDSGDTQVCMNSVNLLEVYYDRLRLDNAFKLGEFLMCAFESPIRIIDTFPRPLLDEAARIKAFYRRVSLADAIGIATAFCAGGIFVTSDHHELDAVNAREAVRFLWIR
ncbi:MAG: PIN domain-containing protein [Spirochaetaceae bacterium]|nr:PIN domain-containing protein [Spirochaetaceae bacterium]